MSRADRLRIDIREMGWLGWITYAIDRTLDRASVGHVRLWAFHFLAQPVPALPMLPPAKGGRMRVGEITSEELDPADFERPEGAVQERFADGSRCIAAIDGDRLAGYMWLHRGPLRERLLACDFEALPRDSACWDYDFEVMPKYRLGRTFARLWDAAFECLRRDGVRHSVSWILMSNAASRRAHERMGARLAGWLLLMECFGARIGVQSQAPYLRYSGRGRRMYVGVRATQDRAVGNPPAQPERGSPA